MKNQNNQNDDFIRYSFYEIRVALDLSEDETQIFLELAKNKLENMNFLVFFTGSKFTYGEASRTVQDNELMIAVKEN